MNLARDFYRPPDALLAGVCAEVARRLGWNVWALRLLFVLGLFIKALPTVVIYAVAALCMGLLLGSRPGQAGGRDKGPGGLASERLAERGRRIQELEEKFRALERDGR